MILGLAIAAGLLFLFYSATQNFLHISNVDQNALVRICSALAALILLYLSYVQPYLTQWKVPTAVGVGLAGTLLVALSASLLALVAKLPTRKALSVSLVASGLLNATVACFLGLGAYLFNPKGSPAGSPPHIGSHSPLPYIVLGLLLFVTGIVQSWFKIQRRPETGGILVVIDRPPVSEPEVPASTPPGELQSEDEPMSTTPNHFNRQIPPPNNGYPAGGSPSQPRHTERYVPTVVGSDRNRPAVAAWLMVSVGRDRGHSYPVSPGDMKIGRVSACPINIRGDEQVGREHALVRTQGSASYLYDLAARNGTFLNDQPVREPRLLRDGDRIRVGNTLLVFKTLG